MTVKPFTSSVQAVEGKSNEDQMSVMGFSCGFASLSAEVAAVPVQGSAGGVDRSGVRDGRWLLHCLRHSKARGIVPRLKLDVTRSRNSVKRRVRPRTAYSKKAQGSVPISLCINTFCGSLGGFSPCKISVLGCLADISNLFLDSTCLSV
jgi:hypothetical protein